MSRCRWGHSCRNVRIGLCRYHHETCPRGMDCSLLQSQECTLFHSKAEHELRLSYCHTQSICDWLSLFYNIEHCCKQSGQSQTASKRRTAHNPRIRV